MLSPLSNPRVGLIAPAGPPLDSDRLTAGLRSLEERGIQIIQARTDYGASGYLAGSDRARLAELHGLMARDEVDIVMCVRGGYGTLRLLNGINYTAAAEHARILVGYSDITALQWALHARSGWTGLSAAMVGVEWAEPSDSWEPQFWQLLNGETGLMLGAADGSVPKTLVAGSVQGKLMGGNLAMITRLLGTQYMPDLTGAILFLEDVGEKPYRIDGMLAHLKLAGVLDRIGGVILGAFTESDPTPGRPSFSVDEVLFQYFGAAPYPVVTGWNYGHFPVKMNMPIGIRAQLSADAESVTLQTIESLLPR
jgi:muramoyltetrapeptide carboxypeptidase